MIRSEAPSHESLTTLTSRNSEVCVCVRACECASVEEEGEVGLELRRTRKCCCCAKVCGCGIAVSCVRASNLNIGMQRQGIHFFQKTALTFDNVPHVQHLINGARSLGEGIS